jgi:hypothetical protein
MLDYSPMHQIRESVVWLKAADQSALAINALSLESSIKHSDMGPAGMGLATRRALA